MAWQFSDRKSGFTLVEMAVVIAIVAIMLSAAIPAMTDVASNSALKNAKQDLAQSIRKAKNIARNRSTRVTLNVTQNSNQISLSSADGSFSQTVTMPSSVSATATDSYQFDSFGLVDKTGTITLTTSLDNQSGTVVIQTLFGQIVVN